VEWENAIPKVNHRKLKLFEENVVLAGSAGAFGLENLQTPTENKIR